MTATKEDLWEDIAKLNAQANEYRIERDALQARVADLETKIARARAVIQKAKQNHFGLEWRTEISRNFPEAYAALADLLESK